MKYRLLGNTGIKVSEIGFGAWGIGGIVKDSMAYGLTDDKESQRALLAAFDSGITFFDTAALYGYGRSEQLIGKALCNVRDKIVISTKAGYINFDGIQDFSPTYLRNSLESSLCRLQTDYVDVFQLHDPLISLLEEDDSITMSLVKMRDEGKIRVIGISTRSPKDCLVAVEHLGFKSVQVNFNLVDQRAIELQLFTACRNNGVGIIVRTPLCFGFLTGKYSAIDKYQVGDHRKNWKRPQIELWAEAYKLFRAKLATKEAQTNAQIALRYVLSFAEVSTTVPGMLTDRHVAENVLASNLGAFPDEVLDGFSEIYRQHSFFVDS
ncbi:MAG: aldo/keto reductase [Rickettsiales bacterium]|jgi:aryl-alcohol dehydrogenase-like predicted oxidoreductase|nr:aldo/keto reductase [Rickettsiales bacterium]